MPGRPKVIIDWKKVDKYLQAHCEGTGIAGILGISAMTLYRSCERDHKVNFEVYAAQKKGEGKQLLRMKQFETAMSGNVSMQIWLGKQYLDQKDKSENTVNVTPDSEILKKARERSEKILNED